MEQSIRRELSQRGIAGSSVEVDVELTQQWQQGLQELEIPFHSRLELVKESLGRLVSHNLLSERHDENY